MNITIEKSKQDAESKVSEYIRCKNDFKHFCENYIYLELPGGDVLMTPYQKQLELVDLITTKKYVLVLKSRQIGISTVIQAYAAWLALFYDNVVVGIISKDGKEATDFARNIRGMIEKVPDWMKPPKGIVGRGFSKRTEQSFILTNGSKIYASPVAPTAPEKTLRGKAITLLVIDEGAFIKFIDTAWTAIVPALSTNQMMAKKNNIPFGTVILSTPNKTHGVGRWFFDNYSKAITGEEIFFPFKIHWKQIPQLASDPNWFKDQCRLFGNDLRKIQQELELKFLSTTGSFFDSDTVEKLQEIDIDPIEKIKMYNGEIWKFVEPDQKRFYLIGVDTAPEHGIDKSAITVWDYETLEQVWEYQGKCRVLDFVKIVKLACALYPGCLVIESNSYGNQVVEELNASEFSLMLYKETRGLGKLVPGLSTNSKTRPLMIDALYSYVTEFPRSIKSKRLVLELISLVSKASGRVEADTDSNDDLVLATSSAFYVRKWDPPLMIQSTTKVQLGDLTQVLDFNISETEISNRSVLRHVKDNIDEMGGFVDILSMYNRGNLNDIQPKK